MSLPARLLLTSWVVAPLWVACGASSSGAGDAAPDGGAAREAGGLERVTPDVVVDPRNCVAPGDPGYCSPGGGQCDTSGPGGSPEICTGDLPETPPHAWYCTLPCDEATPCAGGLACKDTPMGSRCVPPPCVSLLPESGVDAGPEPAGEAGKEAGQGDAAPDARGGHPRDARVGDGD